MSVGCLEMKRREILRNGSDQHANRVVRFLVTPHVANLPPSHGFDGTRGVAFSSSTAAPVTKESFGVKLYTIESDGRNQSMQMTSKYILGKLSSKR